MSAVPDAHLACGPCAGEPLPKFPDLEQRFELIEKMGDGAFSNVYKALDKVTKKLVAVKVVRKHELNAAQRANVLKEVTIMRNLSHSNVVSLISFAESKDFYFLVLELLAGGELFHQIVKLTYFSEDLARHVILQVAHGIRYLHEDKGVVHRDIKPENLLFEPIPFVFEKGKEPKPHSSASATDDDEEKEDEGTFIPGVGGGGIGRIKLADFGLSKVVWDEQTMTPCGTVGYTAPEIVKDERYSKSVDMWALGCVLYTLLCGFPPFYDDSVRVLTEKVAKGYYTFLSPWWDDISLSSKDLISHLLTVDPEKRYTIDEFLAHPWCSKFRPLDNDAAAEKNSMKRQTQLGVPGVIGLDSEGPARKVPSYSTRPKSANRISPPPLIIPPNGFPHPIKVAHPHVTGPEHAKETIPHHFSGISGNEYHPASHLPNGYLTAQATTGGRRLRTPMTPGPMTPGGATMKEVFDVSYAVQRMEEEGAARRRHIAAVQGGHAMPPRNQLHVPSGQSSLSNQRHSNLGRGAVAKSRLPAFSAVGGSPPSAIRAHHRVIDENKPIGALNSRDSDEQLEEISNILQSSRLCQPEDVAAREAIRNALLSPNPKGVDPLEPSKHAHFVPPPPEVVRPDAKAVRVTRPFADHTPKIISAPAASESGFDLCLEKATLLGRRKKGFSPVASPSSSPTRMPKERVHPQTVG